MLRLAPMTLRYLYYALWIIPVPLFVCLTVVMIRRRLHTQLPLFFAFTVFQLVDFGIGFYTFHRSQLDYFYAYWTLAAVGIGLAFGILYEIFTAVFRPFAGLRELGAVLFRWAALVLALAGILLATDSGGMPGGRVVGVILNCVRSVEVMQCGLVLLMLLCSAYLGVTLRHRVFGIALGFGVTAAVDLIAVAAVANLGLQASTFFQLSKMVAFNLSALLWLGYIYAGEVECRPAKQVAYAERWDFALATALHPTDASPALPLIEDMVERVWQQTNGHNGHSKPAGASPHSADQ